MIRHRIAQTAITVALMCALNPVHAQVPVGDGAHIGMQAAQWLKNLEEWQKDAQRWVSGIKSQAAGIINATFNDYNTVDAKEFKEAIDQYKNANPCVKIADSGAQNLCNVEYNFKVKRAEAMFKALEKAQPYLDNIKTMTTELNVLIAQGAASALAASFTGQNVDTKEAAIKTKQDEIEKEYAKFEAAIQKAQASVNTLDEQIKTIHSVRVDYARVKFEGNQPGVLDKLVGTATVYKVVSDETDGYTEEASTLNKKNKY